MLFFIRVLFIKLVRRVVMFDIVKGLGEKLCMCV